MASFPKTNGRVSTTAVGKAIWASAAKAVEGGASLAKAIEAEKDWRHHYPKHCAGVADLGAVSPKAALAIARAGLKAVGDQFLFVRNGKSVPIGEAMACPDPELKFHTGTIEGEAEALELPSGLGGEAGIARLVALGVAGTCEPSVGESVATIAGSSETLQRVLRESVFVLLGGTSEMGPYLPLVQLGATVVVVSRNGAKLKALLKDARTAAAGTVIVPLSTRAQALEDDDQSIGERAGADVIAQAPELAAWLSGLFPQRTMVIGSYIYLDGEAHVRASVAMDAVLAAVVRARGEGKTAAAYIGSPATAHFISREAWNDSNRRFEEQTWFSSLLSSVPYGFEKNARPLVQTTENKEVAVTDGIVVFQGPNYALAKTLQAWRAALLLGGEAGEKGGVVSFNMAPPCRTVSVVHSAQAEKAIRGMESFPPNKAFDPKFVSCVMCMLLLWDLTPAGRSVAAGFTNPNEVSVGNSFHGGSARCAHKTESLGMASYVVGSIASIFGTSD